MTPCAPSFPVVCSTLGNTERWKSIQFHSHPEKTKSFDCCSLWLNSMCYIFGALGLILLANKSISGSKSGIWKDCLSSSGLICHSTSKFILLDSSSASTFSMYLVHKQMTPKCPCLLGTFGQLLLLS